MFATSGTLVLVIPTKDGLIVAADSRSTVLGQYFDGRAKLQVVATNAPVLVTITGTSDFADAPLAGISIPDWMPRATYQYQGTTFVKSYISKQPAFVLSAESLADAATALANSLNEYLRSKPPVAAHYLGQELCRLVLCQASSREKTQIFGSAALRVGADGAVSVQPDIFKVFRSMDPKSLEFVGEDKYTTEHVLGGVGRSFLSEESASIWNERASVKDFSATDASHLATAIIRAAEATTKIIPVPSGNGIGGAVHIYIVTPEQISSLAAK